MLAVRDVGLPLQPGQVDIRGRKIQRHDEVVKVVLHAPDHRGLFRIGLPFPLKHGVDVCRRQGSGDPIGWSNGDVDVLPIALVVVAAVIAGIEKPVLQDQFVTQVVAE